MSRPSNRRLILNKTPNPMAKKKTYIDKIRAQVKADNGGKVPDHLLLTIDNYASALETRDLYREKIIDEGATITEAGSMGQVVTRQHPLCSLLYQQELLCLNYAKALGATSAKAATKTEPGDKDNDKLGDLLRDVRNV